LFYTGIAVFNAAAKATLPEGNAFFALPTQDPANSKQVVVDVDRLRWEVTAAEVFCSFAEGYSVFEPADHRSLPGAAKLLGGHFVFRCKQDEHCKATSNKARLVVQGSSERPGIDFNGCLLQGPSLCPSQPALPLQRVTV
jgi:hypothetical protein